MGGIGDYMLFNRINDLRNWCRTIRRQNQEIIWATVWRDTVQGIDWYDKNVSFSPGRWAVGYNYMYVMTRILEELRPQSVLDFGLGISTSLISMYFDGCVKENGLHVVEEHDGQWIEFYKKKHKLSKFTEINLNEICEKENNNDKYWAYVDISKSIKGRKFDVVSIDGPWGSDGKAGSRRDVLEYLPEILNKEFVIILDDTERAGERQTVEEIVTILRKSGLKIYSGNYSGMKDCTVIVSENNKFLCSL